MKRLSNSIHQQRGVAVLLVLLIFLMSASSLVLSAFGTRQDILLSKQQELSYQMELAKANLLAYAANSHIFHDDGRGPGFLPCPDLSNSGVAPAACSGNVQMGRLPQSATVDDRTMVLNDYYAGFDEQFWYIVGPRYIYDAATTSFRYSRNRTSTTLSGATDYRLTLDGETEYVAMIIAPGEALPTQDRASSPLNYTSYLDGQNGGSGYDFFTSYAVNPELFNDRVIGITLDEYMKFIGIAVVREMKAVLDADHGAGSYVNGPSSPDPFDYDSTGSQWNFRTLFNSEADWLQQSTFSGVSSNNERWTRYSTYIRIDGDNFSIKFQGCDIVFSAAFGSDAITRTGDSC
jgi:hypothetical protein